GTCSTAPSATRAVRSRAAVDFGMRDARATSLTPSGPSPSARSTAKARRMLWTPIVGLDMGPPLVYRDGSIVPLYGTVPSCGTPQQEPGRVADETQEFDLTSLNDDELVEQMHNDLYDGMAPEITEGTKILLGRGWGPEKVLNDALVEGMRIVGIDFRDGILF